MHDKKYSYFFFFFVDELDTVCYHDFILTNEQNLDFRIQGKQMVGEQ